jgi:hypothetical protein
MGEYRFISNGEDHDYQLVWARELWWSKPYEIYLDKTGQGRLNISAAYKKKTARSTFKSPTEAAQIMGILKNMRIKKRDLQAAKFPDGTEQKVLTEWQHVINWLCTARV